MALAPGTHLGPYRLLALLGKGGMGEVYRAKDPKLGREVAIKVLPAGFAEDAERLRRFEQEARAASALNHPNILTIHDLGSHEGSPYLVMELLEGQSLRELMGQGPLAAERVAELGEQIAAGLAAAHERGIVHRDLKPENLFLTHDGVAKILDFGLAKRSQLDSLDSTAAMGAATASGVVMGTLSYMSPEQATGKPVGFPSDQFSLGVVLYELLSGKRPFAGESAAETLAAIVRDAPAPLESLSPGLPPELAVIVARCLAKDPAGRYASTRDLARQLAVARVHAPSAEKAAIGLQLAKVPSKRSLKLPITTGAVILLLAASSLAVWKPWRPAPRRIPSLVALPAKVLGAPESAFLGEAIPELLTTLLSGAEGLETKAPPSAAQVERLQEDLGRIADAYRVDNLLQSTVTAEGERLILSVRIAEAGTRRVRWAAQFTGTRGTYTGLVQQAAEGVAQSLRPASAGLSGVGHAEFSSEVEIALREGDHFRTRYLATRDSRDFDLALASYRKAFALAPASAVLAARIASTFNGHYFLHRDRWAAEETERWLAKALELDPRCGLAWGVKARLETDRAQADTAVVWEGALKAGRFAPDQVVTLNLLGEMAPTFALQKACGDWALRVNPLDARGYSMASSGGFLGRTQEALEIFDRAERVAIRPGLWTFFRFLFLFRAGRFEEARKVHTELGFPEAAKLVCFLMDGDREGGRKHAATLMASLRKRDNSGTDFANYMVFYGPLLIRLGLEEDALWIAEGAARSNLPGNYDFLLTDPDWLKVRSDPRFARALAVSRKGANQFLEIADRAKARGEFPPQLEAALEELRDLLRRNP